jgi:hypothetical protein
MIWSTASTLAALLAWALATSAKQRQPAPTATGAAAAQATVQLLAEHYKAVRDEAVQRIRLKQGLLAFYLAFVGAAFGFSLAKDQTREIAILIPLVSVGVSWMLWDHEQMMVHFGHWMRAYSAYVEQHIVKAEGMPLWDTSRQLEEYAETIKYRFGSYFVLFELSTLVGTAVSLSPHWAVIRGWEVTCSPEVLIPAALAITGVVCALVIAFGTLNVFRARQKGLREPPKPPSR